MAAGDRRSRRTVSASREEDLDEDRDERSETLLSRFARGEDRALGMLIQRETPRILRRARARMKGRIRRRLGASDILQLLGLGATQGTEFVLSATGPDAEEVVSHLADLFANGFGLCGGPD